MNKAVELIGKVGELFVELQTQKIAEAVGRNGWREINAHMFKSKNIVVTNIAKISETALTMTYFDEAEPYARAIMVPPDFMFKLLDNVQAQDLVKKYEVYQLKNLNVSCHFQGQIGSDPEIFVENSKGKIIPAFDFLGSKAKPNKVSGYGERHALDIPDVPESGNDIYWDGFQAEFTTKASFCMGWHGDSLQAGLRGLYELVKAHNKKAKLSSKTVFDIPQELLMSSKPEHVAFGCNPSLNAYGMKGLEMPGTAVEYRSAGGHVHLGFNNKSTLTPTDYVNMVKGLDAIMGVAGVSMCAKFDDPRRRLMYGLAGEYRLPPHGLEYRVLSNAWLFHPVIANIVFDLSRTAAMFGQKNMLKHWNATEQETVECINTCNVDLARQILKRNETLLLRLLDVKLANNECSKFALKAIIEGMESIIDEPTDIVGNWGLDKKWQGHCDGKNKNVHQCMSADNIMPKKKI